MALMSCVIEPPDTVNASLYETCNAKFTQETRENQRSEGRVPRIHLEHRAVSRGAEAKSRGIVVQQQYATLRPGSSPSLLSDQSIVSMRVAKCAAPRSAVLSFNTTWTGIRSSNGRYISF